jgi:hypothetical protein
MRRALVSCVILFVILFVAASLAYPGGTHFDPRAAGHDFWRNTMCDVARGVALDGRPNPIGSALARVAMTVLALGLGVFYLLVPGFFPSRPRAAVAVRALGTLSVPAMVAVVLLPTDRYGAIHGLAIVVAGVPSMSATLMAVHGLVREPRTPRLLVHLGILATLTASAGFAIYVDELVRGGPARLSVAVLERVATLLLLAWMLSLTAAGSTPAPR